MLELTWLIPALPLAGFLVLLLVGRRLGEPGAGWLATLMVAASFVVSVVVFAGLRSDGGEHHRFSQTLFTWLPAGGFRVDIGFLVDPLSITMCLFVTGIAALIHLYSVGYMHGDERFPAFFVYLNLFVFSMLMLVLGDNLLVTFLGWEGVGACSYFLISFWFGQDANASAGKKAFVTNRIGDWGFLVAIFLTFSALGSVRYTDIFSGAGGLGRSTATAIALLLFVGAVGKSAQLPLSVWLPDAMAGPTPVSALIHAATMVTAGVYLMVRMNPVLAEAAPWVLTLIAVVGAVTALFAATIAVAQHDIKKVLAYSTVSQLGYMFLAVGSGAYVAAVFHMVTHAFFKALLFLGSGSVIHGMHDEQDMRRMGGLRALMPITGVTFIIGWLAIAGIPPFAGFWSKDDILINAWEKSPLLWAVGFVTAGLTAYYMSRQVYLTFFGERRWVAEGTSSGGEAEQSAAEVDEGKAGAAAQPARRSSAEGETRIGEAGAAGGGAKSAAQPARRSSAEGETRIGEAGAAGGGAQSAAQSARRSSAKGETRIGEAGAAGGGAQVHESPWTMTVPLVVLAVLSVVGGALNLPFRRLEFLHDWLDPVFAEGSLHELTSSAALKAALLVATTVLSVALALAAAVVYLRRRRSDQERLEPELLNRGWYYDTAVSGFMGGPGRRMFDGLAWFDRTVVDGAVNGVAGLVRGGGDRVRVLQSGFVRNYALLVAAGAIALVAAFVLRGVAL